MTTNRKIDVQISGSVCAGKSLLLGLFAQFLKEKGFQNVTTHNPEGPIKEGADLEQHLQRTVEQGSEGPLGAEINLYEIVTRQPEPSSDAVLSSKHNPTSIGEAAHKLVLAKYNFNLYQDRILPPKVDLFNGALEGINPFSPDLTEEQKQAIIEECKLNPLYFYNILALEQAPDFSALIKSILEKQKEKE